MSVRYAGQILDGPWRGKMHEGFNSSFTIAYCPPARIGTGDDWDSGAVEEIKHGTYKWHSGLNAWTWEGPVR